MQPTQRDDETHFDFLARLKAEAEAEARATIPVVLNFTLIYDPTRAHNTMHMAFQDTICEVRDDNGTLIGTVLGAIGAWDVQDKRTGETWSILLSEVWDAYNAVRAKSPTPYAPAPKESDAAQEARLHWLERLEEAVIDVIEYSTESDYSDERSMRLASYESLCRAMVQLGHTEYLNGAGNEDEGDEDE